MQLPQKWKDSGLSREDFPGLMDPNMTVANAIHNTSMILLHQRIGYPESEMMHITLPSFYSGEVCQAAAIETANIARKYLTSNNGYPVSPQLGFAVFISARVLLGTFAL